MTLQIDTETMVKIVSGIFGGGGVGIWGYLTWRKKRNGSGSSGVFRSLQDANIELSKSDAAFAERMNGLEKYTSNLHGSFQKHVADDRDRFERIFGSLAGIERSISSQSKQLDRIEKKVFNGDH